MTLDEMERAGKKAAAIRGAMVALKNAEQVLDLVNRHGHSGQIWRPELGLRERSSSYANDGVSIRVTIPFGIVQQQALDAVRAARREVIRLGGSISG